MVWLWVFYVILWAFYGFMGFYGSITEDMLNRFFAIEIYPCEITEKYKIKPENQDLHGIHA